MITYDSLSELKSLRNNVEWDVASTRIRFLSELESIIRGWIDELPDLRAIFRPKEIESLLLDSVNLLSQNEFTAANFIWFVVRTGYKNETDANTKPLMRRTTPLHRAFRNFSVFNHNVVCDLFQIYDRRDVNYTDEDGLTHFHVACGYRCYDVVEKFLELGQVDPNLLVEKTGDSPLHFAVSSGNKETIELLLRNGADPTWANKDGWTPLHVICQMKNADELVKIFLKINDKIGQTVQVNAQDKLGNTPLLLASRSGNKKAIKSLLRRGANPNSANQVGERSLHFLSKREVDDDSMELFFRIIDDNQQTVPINVKNNFGNTPLHLAVAFQNIKAVQSLLRRGADPNVANAKGLTPIQLIFQRYRSGNLAEIFFETSKEVGKVVRVDVRDSKGRTLVQLAVLHLLPKLLCVLLKNGANLSNFVFPTEKDFDEHFESYKLLKPRDQFIHYKRIKSGFKLQVMSDALDVIYFLGNRDCQLERSDALTIMKLFDKLGLFEMSEVFDKSWYEKKNFTEDMKKKKINSTLTLYDLMGLRPDEAARIYTYFCHLLTRQTVSFFSSDVVEAAHTYLGTLLLRQFLQSWALDTFFVMIRGRLPHDCCEATLGKLTNQDLYNICLGATGKSYEESENFVNYYLTKSNNKR